MQVSNGSHLSQMRINAAAKFHVFPAIGNERFFLQATPAQHCRDRMGMNLAAPQLENNNIVRRSVIVMLCVYVCVPPLCRNPPEVRTDGLEHCPAHNVRGTTMAKPSFLLMAQQFDTGYWVQVRQAAGSGGGGGGNNTVVTVMMGRNRDKQVQW